MPFATLFEVPLKFKTINKHCQCSVCHFCWCFMLHAQQMRVKTKTKFTPCWFDTNITKSICFHQQALWISCPQKGDNHANALMPKCKWVLQINLFETKITSKKSGIPFVMHQSWVVWMHGIWVLRNGDNFQQSVTVSLDQPSEWFWSVQWIQFFDIWKPLSSHRAHQIDDPSSDWTCSTCQCAECEFSQCTEKCFQELVHCFMHELWFGNFVMHQTCFWHTLNPQKSFCATWNCCCTNCGGFPCTVHKLAIMQNSKCNWQDQNCKEKCWVFFKCCKHKHQQESIWQQNCDLLSQWPSSANNCHAKISLTCAMKDEHALGFATLHVMQWVFDEIGKPKLLQFGGKAMSSQKLPFAEAAMQTEMAKTAKLLVGKLFNFNWAFLQAPTLKFFIFVAFGSLLLQFAFESFLVMLQCDWHCQCFVSMKNEHIQTHKRTILHEQVHSNAQMSDLLWHSVVVSFQMLCSSFAAIAINNKANKNQCQHLAVLLWHCCIASFLLDHCLWRKLEILCSQKPANLSEQVDVGNWKSKHPTAKKWIAFFCPSNLASGKGGWAMNLNWLHHSNSSMREKVEIHHSSKFSKPKLFFHKGEQKLKCSNTAELIAVLFKTARHAVWRHAVWRHAVLFFGLLLTQIDGRVVVNVAHHKVMVSFLTVIQCRCNSFGC